MGLPVRGKGHTDKTQYEQVSARARSSERVEAREVNGKDAILASGRQHSRDIWHRKTIRPASLYVIERSPCFFSVDTFSRGPAPFLKQISGASGRGREIPAFLFRQIF